MFLYKKFDHQDSFKWKEYKINLAKLIYCLIPSLLVFVSEVIVWMSGGAYANFLEKTGAYVYDFTIPSIDYNFPILLWLVPFYYTSTIFFVITPMFIFLLNGKDALFRTINTGFLVFATSFILYFTLPTSSRELAKHGLEMLGNAKGWFADITRNALDYTSPGSGFSAFHSCFPSMHCNVL